MVTLIDKINLIYLFFLATSMLFFSYQFLNNSIPVETFVNIVVFFIISNIILSFSYRKSKKRFNLAIESMKIEQKVATPTMMLVFLGGFSIALAIIFIAFLEALGILFVVESMESLILNVLAMISFFWLAFVLFMGWDFIKIAGNVSQYSLMRKEKRSSFWINMKIFFRKSKALREAFLGFVSVDLACRKLSKINANYYKNLLYPVKAWSACLTLFDGKYVADSLTDSFAFFKSKSFKLFYASQLAPVILPLVVVPIIFSLGAVLSNFWYFSNLECLHGICFSIIIYFLIFISLGFFFSYSIIISLESAYYVKILSDIKDGKVSDVINPKDYTRIRIIEEDCMRRLSKLKGNIWDIFRVYR